MSITKGKVGLHVKERSCEFVVDIKADVIKSNAVCYVYVRLDIYV
jgi:hypothetical protein